MKKKNNNNKFIIFVGVFLLVSLIFVFKKNKSTFKETVTTSKSTKKYKPITKKEAKQSVSKNVEKSTKPLEKKHSKSQQKKSIQAGKWEQAYTQNFMRMTKASPVTNFHIKNLKKVTLLKNKRSIHAQHVIISYKNAAGIPMSFEAHINSQTGQLIQSWNKTRLERRKTASLDPQGREYNP